MDKRDTQAGTSAEKNDGTTSPRHWMMMDELDPGYWDDSSAQEKRQQEFLHKPVETVEMLERLDSRGVNRRNFLTIMGASMAMAGFACARRPVHKIIPYVVKPEEITPGVPNWYASTNEDGVGVLVKTREGRPIKLEGNPDHPVSEGRLSARGQAALLNLYDPDRLKHPVRIKRGKGLPKKLSWDELDREVAGKLRAAKTVRVLSDPLVSPSSRRLVNEFLSAFPDGKLVEYRPLGLSDLVEAQERSYGKALIPHYRFDRADYVVSLGADFLGTWNSPVEYANQWVKKRVPDSESPSSAEMSKLVVFEATPSVTGNNADEKYLVRAGREISIAMALAHELIVERGRSRFAGDASVKAALKGFSVEEVAEASDELITVDDLRGVAEKLWNHRGSSLVVAGDVETASADGVGLQIAVNLLNSILDNEGRTVDASAGRDEGFSSVRELKRLIDEMKTNQVDVLIVHRSNPVYSLPEAMGFHEAARFVKTIVNVSDRVDETALYSDYVAAMHHFLENWGDARPRAGVYSLQQPALAPVYETRGFQDSLLAWSKGAGKASGLSRRSDDWHAYLKGAWREMIYPRRGVGRSFESFWEDSLRTGVVTVSESVSGGRSFRVSALRKVKLLPSKSGTLSLALYEKVGMGDGRSANNAWLQELPDPVTSVTWDNYANVSPRLAEKMGLSTHDVVELTLNGVKTELPVNVLPGVHPDTVSVAVGYGRDAAGKVGNQVGRNTFRLSRYSEGRIVYSGQDVKIRRTGRRYELAITQGHFRTMNRPIINDITLAQFRENPAAESHTNPHLRLKNMPDLWGAHDYSKGYRWGMAIDLNACTGCSACMIACQAENNIPVVGRDRVRFSREMHWIRIDRYYSGDPVNPQVVYQPMLCQHCENASCETVCPVLATVHNEEGLNEMVYNRCVGTRYCQNNCPYKVRRFNFFDHWKDYRDPMNLVWNPDVTVRSRGVMEKCTFCVQRIQDAKDKAKDEGRKVKDGELQTACQQTCPTDAIVFGNINDSSAKVTEAQADPRGYRVIEIVGNKPQIVYQTKVRNTEMTQHQEGDSHGHH